MRGDRAQPVVAGEAAVAARLQPPSVEIDLVVDDEDRVRLDLVEARGGADRPPGVVHVRLRLQQPDAMAVDADLRDAAGELPLPGAAVPPRELVHDHPTDVVPVAGVLATRIP